MPLHQLKGCVAGVDYGGKTTGTTVLAVWQAGQFALHPTRVNQNADRWLLNTLTELQPSLVFMDAPLGLPGVYRGLKGCTDYHKRAVDHTVGAMSPMYLGGFTARAMELAAQLTAAGLQVHETYPKQVAKNLGLDFAHYKNKKEPTPNIEATWQQLQQKLDWLPTMPAPHSWDMVDATLALHAAMRFASGQGTRLGNKEGYIWV